MGGLLQSLRTGENAFTHVCGRSFFEYLAEHAEFADVFNNAMTSSSRIAAGALLSAYDFSMFKRVVDIAGGQGEFMTAILAKCPSVHGVVYDRPAVVADADIPSVLANRFSVVTGNFFERIPEGADAYVLRRILHDWNDANALLILQNCRRAMTRESKLLIIELAPPEPGESGNNWAAQDLLMMLLMDGRERNAVDFHDLLSRAGFQIARTLRTNSPYWIVEVDPA
jgi:hypothetical protein